jgi:hypothetical protein
VRPTLGNALSTRSFRAKRCAGLEMTGEGVVAVFWKIFLTREEQPYPTFGRARTICWPGRVAGVIALPRGLRIWSRPFALILRGF